MASNKALVDLLNESNIYPYNEEAHTGDLRHLVLRCNSKNEFMLILVLRENKPKIHSFISKIKSPLIKSLYININPNKTNVILGKEFIHVKAGIGTHLYNTAEMSKFIEGVIQEAQALGIETKTPNEITQMMSLWATER